MRAKQFYWPALWILAAAVVIAHVVGAGSVGGALWGADAYAYLPRVALVAALSLLALVLFVALRPPAWLDRALSALPVPAERSTARTWARALAAMGASLLLYWLFREGHTLLGDGSPLTRSLPEGQRFHPSQPLTFLIHHWFYGLAHGVFRLEDPAEAARATVALSSAIAGALFVPVAWGLASELARTLRPDPAEDRVAAGRSVVPLAFLVLLAQGYVQLFFGYVENYAFTALALGVYLLVSLRHLRGAAPLALPGLTLVLNVGLNLSAILLLPSFLVLLARALVTPAARWPALRDLALMGLLGAGINAVMAAVRPGFNLAAAASQIVLQALFARGDRAQSLAYMFSGVHVRDFLNAQMLIGPAAAFLFVAGLAWLAVARARPTAIGAYFLAVGLVAVAGAWVTTDLGLGYARDWDLFAPSGIALTAAGLHMVLSGAWRGAELRRWLLALAAVCLFHAVPWVAVNASFDRSFARFKTLPLGLGRTESAVGAQYLAMADTVQAIVWFQRAVDVYPANNVAAFRLGEIAIRRRMYPEAARAFTTALRSRPDKEIYRYALVDAILRGGAPLERAKPQVDTLIQQRPDEPLYWAALGMAHLGTGERDHAASAFQRAHDLAPDDTAYAKLLREADREDEDLPDVREEWPALVDP